MCLGPSWSSISGAPWCFPMANFPPSLAPSSAFRCSRSSQEFSCTPSGGHGCPSSAGPRLPASDIDFGIRGSGMNFGIEGKRALVCGASRGIGFSCAEMLAAEGANLVLVARGAERLDQAAEELRSKFDVDVETLAVDLSGTEGRQHVIANCGAVDILIHNGGWPVADRDFREW